MPYLIGIPKKTLQVRELYESMKLNPFFVQKVPRDHLADVVIVDLDSKTLTNPYNDMEALPSEVVCLFKF